MLQPQPHVFVFICPFALSNFIHTFYTSNEFSLTNSTYKISTRSGQQARHPHEEILKLSCNTNLSRLRIVSMALWSSPRGCPALEEVVTRPLPLTAVGDESPKSIFQTRNKRDEVIETFFDSLARRFSLQ